MRHPCWRAELVAAILPSVLHEEGGFALHISGTSSHLHTVAMAAILFNRWAKNALPVSNSIMAVDVLLGIYVAEKSGKQPTSFKELCWDLRCSEQAIRSIVERLKEARWIVLEQDERFRRSISRLRIPADKVGQLEEGLRLLQGQIELAATREPA